MSEKVYVDLVGGLGNQLFQVAAAITVAARNQKEVRLVDSHWSAHQGNPPETYKDTWFKKFIFEEPPEKASHYHEEIPDLAPKGDIYLHGYFQSKKFQLLDAQVYRESFGVNHLGLCPGTAVHIRRGDYLSFAHKFLVCDDSYFRSAFSMVPPPWFLYTDDEHWVKTHYGPLTPMIQSVNEQEALLAMIQRQWLVGSNSSLSWWGARLSLRPENQNIMPGIWIKDEPEVNANIYYQWNPTRI